MLDINHLLRFMHMTHLRTRISRLFAALTTLFLGAFSFAFAQGPQPTGNASAANSPLGQFLLLLVNIINTILVPLIFALAFIVFIWGVFNYFVYGAANQEKRDEGKKFVMWGIIGFFVMLSIWGIINVLGDTFGISGDSQPEYPTFTVQNQNTTDSGSDNVLNGLPASGSASGNTQTNTAVPDCRTHPGVCPAGKACSSLGVCVNSGSENTPGFTPAKADCRKAGYSCSSAYACNQSTGECELDTI